MPHLSINELTTYRWNLAEDVAHCGEFGIPAIGVWRAKLSDYGQQRGVDYLRRSGIQVSNLMWAGGFTGSEGRPFEDSVDDAEEAIRQASRLGAYCLVVYSGGRHGHTQSHARRLMISAMRELASFAGDLDVCLAIEPVHSDFADQWSFLNTIDDTLDLIAECESPHVRLALDTYHSGQEDNLLDKLSSIASQLAIVHLGDTRAAPTAEHNRCRLGEGIIPLREIIEALSQGGYDGYYDVLLRGEDVEPYDYEALIAHSKEAFHDLLSSPAH